MGRDLVQVRPRHVHPAHDQVGPDVTLKHKYLKEYNLVYKDKLVLQAYLVAEEHLLDQPVGGHHPDLPAGVEPVQLELAADGGGGLVAVRRCPLHATLQSSIFQQHYPHRAGTVDVGRHVVELLAVLVRHNVAASGPGVGAQDHSVLEDDSTDGCTSLGHLHRQRRIVIIFRVIWRPQ